MYNVRKVTDDLYWVGANDRRLALFENVYPLPQGISYNSYLLLDEKTVLLDTVDAAAGRQFFENITHVLNGRPLDYLIINHMEPDHCAEIENVWRRYPQVKLICNAQTQKMLQQFFSFSLPTEQFILVKEGDEISTGRHTFRFVMAPMVHWPEVMVSYETNDKILFSADAFGTFGTLDGRLFADEADFSHQYLDEARRYYANIVGKYGVQVQSLLKKVSALDIKMICPLHGFVWRKDLPFIIDKYQKWSLYEAEEDGVVIIYGSIYGNTENAAEVLACRLAEKGMHNIRMFDVSKTHASYIISEIFRCAKIVFAAATYNGGIFVNMENLLHDIIAHNVQNRRIALLDNGTWAAMAGKLMRSELEKLKNCTIIEPTISLKSALKEEQYEALDNMATQILDD